jgi:hypothetical protein
MIEIQQQPLIVPGHARRRIPLRIDIGEDRTEGLSHGPGAEALGRDQNQPPGLSFLLEADYQVQVRIYFRDTLSNQEIVTPAHEFNPPIG